MILDIIRKSVIFAVLIQFGVGREEQKFLPSTKSFTDIEFSKKDLIGFFVVLAIKYLAPDF